MSSVRIDFSKPVGKIKPVHGVNSGPQTKVFTYDASELFREIGIPYSRLHDTEYPYGSGEFVDIHCVFPDFDADENDPASYNFGLTDCYIKAALDVGTDLIYRLGESIEHAPVKRHIHPPKDFAKWARIAEHIIRHYNEGWAGGHRWGIPYWEIWNEPDLDVNSANKKCWSGTVAQFHDFFETTAKHLKSCFPELKIGGPAIAGKYGWASDFLHEMSRRGVGLDFFSWHRYTGNPADLGDAADRYRALMDECGYRDAEMLLDEWNYMENWGNQPESFRRLVGIRGAAFCAASLIVMQKSPVDAAAYFEADVIKEWCGLFEVEDMAIDSLASSRRQGKLKPRKPFVSFREFGRLYRIGTEVFSESDNGNMHVCAAANAAEAAALIAVRDIDAGFCEITLTGLGPDTRFTVIKTDQNGTDIPVGTFASTGGTMTLTLPFDGDSVIALHNA
ncbi:MAG: hypothetical protein IJ037_04775 [Clostridia bacterium]|nr:hypothetical protein [Clostridia bacterium]